MIGVGIGLRLAIGLGLGIGLEVGLGVGVGSGFAFRVSFRVRSRSHWVTSHESCYSDTPLGHADCRHSQTPSPSLPNKNVEITN